jgi:hypothetical protein
LPVEVPLPAFMRDTHDVWQESAPRPSESEIRNTPGGIQIINSGTNRATDLDYDVHQATAFPYDTRTDIGMVNSRESAIPLTNAMHTQHDQNGIPSYYSKHTNTELRKSSIPFDTPARPFPPVQRERAYCDYCKIYKPWRAHHCRICGTCVLGMECVTH